MKNPLTLEDLDPKLDGDDDEDIILRDIIAKLVDAVCMQWRKAALTL